MSRGFISYVGPPTFLVQNWKAARDEDTISTDQSECHMYFPKQ